MSETMTHDDAVSYLPMVAGGEASPSLREAVERHVLECPRCRGWLDTYELLRRDLGGRDVEDDGAGGHPPGSVLALCAVRPGEEHEPGMNVVREHLEACPSCRRDLEVTGAALRGGRPAQPPVPTRAKRRWLPVVARRVLLAAGIVLAVLGAASLVLGRLGRPWAPQSQALRAPGAPAGVSLPDITEISDTSIYSSGLIEGGRVLKLSQVHVDPGVSVTFRAAEGIVLHEGFRTGPRARVAIDVTGRTAPASPRSGAGRIE